MVSGKRAATDRKGLAANEHCLNHKQDCSDIIVVTAVQSNITKTKITIGKHRYPCNALLDSGSTICLIREDIVAAAQLDVKPQETVTLLNASGGKIELSTCTTAPLELGGQRALQQLWIVKELVCPVILGTNFMEKHAVEIDFKQKQVKVQDNVITAQEEPVTNERCTVHNGHTTWENHYSATMTLPDTEETDECAIPDFGSKADIVLPTCSTEFQPIVEEFKEMFSTRPGKTETIEHSIPTAESTKPVRIPPRRVPAHYKSEVSRQINEMLQQGIISESSSPWLAPCVFVPKSNGELRICVDYRELNKRTQKNSYPLPLPDEVQDRIAGSKIFSKLDCRKGFWQMPLHSQDRHKTAFSPGPGMGLYEFNRLPFGLSGAPGSFQRLMEHGVLIFQWSTSMTSLSLRLTKKHTSNTFVTSSSAFKSMDSRCTAKNARLASQR